MFQEIKNQEAEQKPDIQAFLALYAKFQAGTAWLAKREAEGSAQLGEAQGRVDAVTA